MQPSPRSQYATSNSIVAVFTVLIVVIIALSVVVAQQHGVDWQVVFNFLKMKALSVVSAGAVLTVAYTFAQFMRHRKKNEGPLRGVDAAFVRSFQSKSNSDSEFNLVEYFRNLSCALLPYELVARNILIRRSSIDRIRSLDKECLVYRIHGDESSGKTLLGWQLAYNLFINSYIIIELDGAKVTDKTFEKLFTNITFARLWPATNYALLIDGVDQLSRDAQKLLRACVETAAKTERSLRSGPLRRRLPWGRLWFVVISSEIRFESVREVALSAALMPDEEAILFDRIKSALGPRALPDFSLEAVWRQTGGRRSYNGSISAFIADVLIVSGAEDVLPAELMNEEVTEAVQWIAPFTMLSLPVRAEHLPPTVRRIVERELDSKSESRIFSEEKKPFMGVQLRLKPWATLIINRHKGDLHNWLAEIYIDAVDRIAKRDSQNRIEADWVRHLLHRITKRRNIGAVDFNGEVLGREVVTRCVEQLDTIIKRVKSIEDLALWLGTLSSIRNDRDRVSHPGVLKEILRRLAGEEVSEINRYPSAFINLAKGTQALWVWARESSKKEQEGMQLIVGGIIDNLNIDQIIDRDHELNHDAHWHFRFAQTIESFLKLRRIPAHRAGGTRKYSTLDDVAFIDMILERHKSYDVVPTALLMLRKAKVYVKTRRYDLAWDAFERAAELASSPEEHRENPTLVIYVLYEYTNVLGRTFPDEVARLHRLYLEMFRCLSETADYVPKNQLAIYYRRYFDFLERRPEAVELVSAEFIDTLVATCRSGPPDRVFVPDRYRIFIEMGILLRAFPLSLQSGSNIGEILTRFHQAAVRGCGISLSEISGQIERCAWGTGISFEFPAVSTRLLTLDARTSEALS